MASPGAPEAQQDTRNLKETLNYHQREVQDTQAWLQRTYAALDEQAAQAGQECIDRYLLNNTLLAQLFSGPGPLPEPLGGRTDVKELAARLIATAAASSPEEQPPATGSAGEDAGLEDFMNLLESIRTAGNAEELEKCQKQYEQHKARRRKRPAYEVTSAEGRQQDERKRTISCIAPGVHRVELFDNEQSSSSGGGSPARL